MAAVCLCLVRSYLHIRNVCLGLCGWPFHWWYSYSAYRGSSVWLYSPCMPIAIPVHWDTYRRSTRSCRFTWVTNSFSCPVSWDSCWPVCLTVDWGKSINNNIFFHLSYYYLPVVITIMVVTWMFLFCSILVSNLNSISTVAWEDFISQIPIFKSASEKNQVLCIKGISKYIFT